MEEEKLDNWRAFQGTELGGLLGKIYGNENKPVINYPKPKVKPRQQTEPYLPCGKANATDPRKSTRTDVNVVVPKFGASNRKSEPTPMIAYVPRRRNEESIKNEIEEINMRNASYRPAYIKPISTEEEKDKLSQINTYHGGKALPAEGIQAVGEAPFERQARLKEQERMNNIKNKYNPGRNRVSQPLSHNENLADHISKEINERCDYLTFLEENRGSKQEIQDTKKQIADRTRELNALMSKI